MNPHKHRKGTGVSNEIILDNLEKLSKSNVPLIVRLPLIPKFNLDHENILCTAKFLSGLRSIKDVNLMPFHQLGKDKYYRLSLEYSLKKKSPLGTNNEDITRIKYIRKVFESFGLNVTVR